MPGICSHPVCCVFYKYILCKHRRESRTTDEELTFIDGDFRLSCRMAEKLVQRDANAFCFKEPTSAASNFVTLSSASCNSFMIFTVNFWSITSACAFLMTLPYRRRPLTSALQCGQHPPLSNSSFRSFRPVQFPAYHAYLYFDFVSHWMI